MFLCFLKRSEAPPPTLTCNNQPTHPLDATQPSNPQPQGVLYHDRMKPAALSKIRERLVALEEEFIAANPGVEVQRVAPESSKGLGFGPAKGKGFGGSGAAKRR